MRFPLAVWQAGFPPQFTREQPVSRIVASHMAASSKRLAASDKRRFRNVTINATAPGGNPGGDAAGGGNAGDGGPGNGNEPNTGKGGQNNSGAGGNAGGGGAGDGGGSSHGGGSGN